MPVGYFLSRREGADNRGRRWFFCGTRRRVDVGIRGRWSARARNIWYSRLISNAPELRLFGTGTKAYEVIVSCGCCACVGRKTKSSPKVVLCTRHKLWAEFCPMTAPVADPDAEPSSAESVGEWMYLGTVVPGCGGLAAWSRDNDKTREKRGGNNDIESKATLPLANQTGCCGRRHRCR